MKVDVFSVSFHRESVTLDEEEKEVGRSTYGRQTVLVAGPTSALAIAVALAGQSDAVLDGSQAVLQGVEIPDEFEAPASDELLEASNKMLAELVTTQSALESANKQNDVLTEQIKSANDLLHAAQARIEELTAQLNQKPVDPPAPLVDPMPVNPTSIV